MVSFRFGGKEWLAGIAGCALWCAAGICSAAPAAPALLNPVFRDHAVLQRDHADPVWGRAAPGTEVAVQFAGHRLRARADAAGDWHAVLPALSAGGPYTLTVRAADGATQTIDDVLVGDVWLCAGQSNMALPVWRTLNQRVVFQTSGNDRLRMLTVSDTSRAAPQQAVPAADHWQIAGPDTVPKWSATCYYFARELQKKVPVPMGMVVAAWGGSRIEPWMTPAALGAVGGYAEPLKLLAQYARDPSAAGRAWGRDWMAWWLQHAGTTARAAPWSLATAQAAGWKPAPLTLGAWQHWGVPDLAHFNGMVWFRTTVTLTPAQAAQGATLRLLANETDQTFVNGHWVGSTFGGSQRAYRVPKGVLRAGTNLIAVNVLDTFEEGGVQGAPSTRALRLDDGTTVSLATHWQYQPVPLAFGAPPSTPWDPVAGVSTLYNGMLAPLDHYAFRGVLWYQGASNAGDPGNYRSLLESLRRQFRAQFGASLPMLIVQLSNFGPPSATPGPSGWADIREAQRVVADEDPNSALAVSFDIGERDHFIHPANKLMLGERLSRAALHLVYGDKSLSPSGPVPIAAVRAGRRIKVTFKDVTGGLVSYSTNHPISFELCTAQKDGCQYATADLEGDAVLLGSPLPIAQVTRVRYCWADTPICTLYDQSGLPAGPFQLSVGAAHAGDHDDH